MEDLVKRSDELRAAIDAAYKQLHIAQFESELTLLQTESQQKEFWSQSTKAQGVMQKISQLDEKILLIYKRC